MTASNIMWRPLKSLHSISFRDEDGKARHLATGGYRSNGNLPLPLLGKEGNRTGGGSLPRRDRQSRRVEQHVRENGDREAERKIPFPHRPGGGDEACRHGVHGRRPGETRPERPRHPGLKQLVEIQDVLRSPKQEAEKKGRRDLVPSARDGEDEQEHGERLGAFFDDLGMSDEGDDGDEEERKDESGESGQDRVRDALRRPAEVQAPARGGHAIKSGRARLI